MFTRDEFDEWMGWHEPTSISKRGLREFEKELVEFKEELRFRAQWYHVNGDLDRRDAVNGLAREVKRSIDLGALKLRLEDIRNGNHHRPVDVSNQKWAEHRRRQVQVALELKAEMESLQPKELAGGN